MGKAMEFEELASGYCFLEAPRFSGEQIWFTDVLLGGIYRLAPDGRIDTFLSDRRHSGGICLNEDGRLICGGRGGIIWLDPATGETGTVLNEIPGDIFTGSNDFIPDSRGGLYFGTLSNGGDYGEVNVPTAIWRIDADGRVTMQDDGLKVANGLGLSPDGKHLYHCESLVGIFAYDIGADGNLSGKRLFNARTDGDGLAVDAEGGVWAACFDLGMVVRLAPDGSEDRQVVLPQPHKVVTSLCFGGPDWRDLYVVTAGSDGVNSMMRGELPAHEASLFRARSDIPGSPVPATRFRTG
jgi:sugar lactone lactonase YvrE